jgi:hypothetical protein
MSGGELDDVDRLGRLEGIQRHLQSIEGWTPYLHLPNLFDADPVAEPPYRVANSFIPESIGGNVRVVHREPDSETSEPLDTENLEQMLGSYLPGGYKRRWGNFNLWQGTWEVVRDPPGRADIDPMFEFGDKYPLSEFLATEQEDYTGLELPTDEVTVYVPRMMYVQRLPQKPEYRWHVGLQNVFADRDPPGKTLPLGRSDPTTNYLWFRHFLDEPAGEPTPLDESTVVDGYRFQPETEFLRCYYASLLTIYEKDSNETLSRVLTYEHGDDDCRAFVGAYEESQLLLFDLDRATIRSRIAHVFSEHSDIERDTRFSLLYREVWDRLFFHQEVLENVFAIDPFVKHLLATDFWVRDTGRYDADTVFELGIGDLEAILQELLDPGRDDGGLTLMGYDSAPTSNVLRAIRNHGEVVEAILETCQGEAALLDFAEDVVIHSLEHAFSTWAAEETPAGGSFELWYDVNFQQRDDMIAHAGIYDSIQGGAGIATEVHDHLASTGGEEFDRGLARQGACHTAAADETVLELLADADGEILYDLFAEDRADGGEAGDEESAVDTEGVEQTGFQARLETAQEAVLRRQAGAYNADDVTSNARSRVRSLFETRELAQFYAYVASQYEDVAETVDRTPRSVDLLLHLDRDIIRDPQVRETYLRFAEGTKRRDLSELGERLEELALQCITACPDCLETDGTNCVHGMKYQSELLNRRLLAEVCSY